jgi:hypothetical protein
MSEQRGWQRHLLKIDSVGGLIAGVIMLALSGWLSGFHRLPQAGIVAMGIANLGYGTYSGLLHRRRVRPIPLIVLLVLANAAWAVLCWSAAARYAGSASLFGMVHLIGEGGWVAALAVLEWRARDILRMA